LRDETSTTVAIRSGIPPYLVSRLLLGIAAAIVIASLPGRSIGPTTVFTTWDSQWYLSIAEHGYVPDQGAVRPNGPAGADTSVDGAVAFFPMYPMAVAALGALIPIGTDDVAIGAAILFGAAATIAYAKLARGLRGSEEADRAVLLFCFFPRAFVLSLAYPEGLLILFACVCLLQLQRRAWVLAGAFAAARPSAERSRAHGVVRRRVVPGHPRQRETALDHRAPPRSDRVPGVRGFPVVANWRTGILVPRQPRLLARSAGLMA
jgi:Gpi18-like mannosyltransferase